MLRRSVYLALTVVSCGMLGCSFNQAKVSPAPVALTLDILGVTRVDLETQNARHRIYLSWPQIADASLYEVIRRLDGRPASVQTARTETAWVDDALIAGQGAGYKVQALSSKSQVLTVSDEKSVTLLASEVAPPTGLKPSNNAVLDVGDVPTFSWDRMDDAQWYYVSVVRANDDRLVYSAMTSSTSIKFGERSPLQLEKFPGILPVESGAGLERGVVHKWTVSSVRTTGGSDPSRVTAIDVRASELQRFSVGG